MGERLTFPRSVTVAHVVDLRQNLLNRLATAPEGTTFTLVTDGLGQPDSACVQLVVALVKEVAERGHRLTVEGPPLLPLLTALLGADHLDRPTADLLRAADDHREAP